MGEIFVTLTHDGKLDNVWLEGERLPAYHKLTPVVTLEVTQTQYRRIKEFGIL